LKGNPGVVGERSNTLGSVADRSNLQRGDRFWGPMNWTTVELDDSVRACLLTRLTRDRRETQSVGIECTVVPALHDINDRIEVAHWAEDASY
jgi:hypothetical protein